MLEPLPPTLAATLGREISSRTLGDLQGAAGATPPTPTVTSTPPLSPSLSEVRAASNEPNLTIAEGQAAVAAALANGEAILLTLQSLERLAVVAGSNGLTSDATTLLNAESTRVSRLNLDVEAQRLLAAIDQLVENSRTSGISLISSSPSEATVQSSLLGGRVTVLTQPLDTTGLGLTGLSLVDQTAAFTAQSQVRIAFEILDERVTSLESLERALNTQPSRADSILLPTQENSSLFSATSRGTRVDLIA